MTCQRPYPTYLVDRDEKIRREFTFLQSQGMKRLDICHELGRKYYLSWWRVHDIVYKESRFDSSNKNPNKTVLFEETS